MHSPKKLFAALVFGALAFAPRVAVASTALRSLDAKTETPSWKLVAGGAVAAVPVNTSYGFAMLTDGRMISAVGKSGKLLWQRGIKGSPTGFLTCESDFLLVVTDKSTLNLVNPSGITLWSVKTGFDIIENPRMARDGRIFVRGKEHIACYGLHGVRKWLIRTEKQRADIPLMLFDDGSIFTFLEATEDSKSRAQLISVFGKPLEITTFTAYVTAASETKYGALLALQGGGAGLCAVENGTAESKWVTQGVCGSVCPALSLFSSGEEAAFFWQSGKGNLTATFVQVRDGKKGELSTLGTFSLNALTHLSVHERGIALADTSRALLLSADGSVSWEAALPGKNVLAGLFYTDDNALVIYRKDWLMQAFVMQQSTQSRRTTRTEAHTTYAERKMPSGTIGHMAYERISDADISFMQSSLSRGDYSEREADWASHLQLEMQNWLYDLNTQTLRFYDGTSYFFDNPVYAEQLLSLAAASGTADYARLLADLLSAETRKQVIIQIINACGTLAWDDEGVMLKAIEEVLHKASPRDTVLLKAICDATYDICRYMGKPALLSKGKNMLSFLLFPQFDSTTRDYARKTIKNILDLQL